MYACRYSSISSSFWLFMYVVPALSCIMSNDQRLMFTATPFMLAAFRIAFTPSMWLCGSATAFPSEPYPGVTVPFVWNHQRMTRPPASCTFLNSVLNVLMFGFGTSPANCTQATLTPLAKLQMVPLPLAPPAAAPAPFAPPFALPPAAPPEPVMVPLPPLALPPDPERPPVALPPDPGMPPQAQPSLAVPPLPTLPPLPEPPEPAAPPLPSLPPVPMVPPEPLPPLPVLPPLALPPDPVVPLLPPDPSLPPEDPHAARAAHRVQDSRSRALMKPPGAGAGSGNAMSIR